MVIGREYRVTSLYRTTSRARSSLPAERVILVIENQFRLVLRSPASEEMLKENRSFYKKMKRYARYGLLKVVYFGYDRFDLRYGYFEAYGGEYISRIMRVY